MVTAGRAARPERRTRIVAAIVVPRFAPSVAMTTGHRLRSGPGEFACSVELVRCGSDSRLQDELFGSLQGDDFGAADGLLPEVVGQGDQWRGGGERDDVGIEGQVVGVGAAGHADGGGVDDQAGAEVTDLGGGLEAVLLGQGVPGVLVAGDDVPVAEPAVPQAATTALAMPPLPRMAKSSSVGT